MTVPPRAPSPVRSRLEANAAVLMASSALTGVLGIGYWIVAERFFPTEQVGQASATISTATMLGSLACLSLGGSYQRFLPLAGERARRFVVGGLGLTAAVAVLLGIGFTLVGPGREQLFQTSWERWSFPLLVVVLTGYGLLDPILIALRRARTVAAKNVAHAVLKILALPLLAFTASGLALSASWGVLALLVSLVVLAALLRAGPAIGTAVPSALPPVRQVWAFQGASFAMTAVLTITPLALPLVVLSSLGPEYSAYFNLVAALGTAASMLRASVLSSYVVEASSPYADRAALTRRMVRLMVMVCAATAGGFAIGGPILLAVVGADYAAAATSLVLVMAVEALVGGITAGYAAISQITRRLRLLVASQVVIVALTVGGALVLVPRLGLVGVGLASLGAQVVAVVAVARSLRSQLRELRAPVVAEGAIR